MFLNDNFERTELLLFFAQVRSRHSDSFILLVVLFEALVREDYAFVGETQSKVDLLTVMTRIESNRIESNRTDDEKRLVLQFWLRQMQFYLVLYWYR